ncbi:MAG: AAA family ATPase [Bacteroidales bacterium]|nr:AAA family ATPase [Bacteroidales bacterium]
MSVNTATYFSRLRELVGLELREEQEAYRRSLEHRGLGAADGIREPSCRYPVSLGASDYNAMGQLTLELRYEVADDEVELDFEPGRPVTLFYLANDGAKEMPHQCYVELVRDGAMTISVPSKAAIQSIRSLADRNLIGVQLGVDNTSFRVMDGALTEAARKEDERFVRLRDVLLDNAKPSFRSLPRLSFPWLNRSQEDAIQKVVEAQEVSIIHGPPGTGKTTTLVEAIIETLQRETQVLVCAPSNAAVDWISTQLMRRGVGVLRVGNPLRMSDETLECSYERRYAAHPDYHELWNIRRTLREGGIGPEKARKLRERQNELELKINNDIFNEARVVSCTLVGSAYRIMDRRRFSTLFIDEAAQALEPACWAAILRADRVVMGGDHQQLPPTVKSLEAARGGLADTLMQKVVGLHPQCVSLLTVQYRMNKAIMAFSSRWFYHGQLKAAPEAAQRLVSPLDTPLTWIDTSGSSGNSGISGASGTAGTTEARTRTGSLTNSQEARLVIHTLRDYIDMVSPGRVESERVDFGIITPYRGQARLIRRLLKMQHYFRKLRRHITVGTVDGFQGQERDVIVISLVRSNAEGSIGFLRDLRRMNVAMTRARMKLIIVGNAETLSHHRFYRELIEHVRRHGEFVCVPSSEPTVSNTTTT